MSEQIPSTPEQLPAEPELLPVPPPELPFLQRIPPVPFAIATLALIFVLYQVVNGAITLLLFPMDFANPDAGAFEANKNGFRWATLVGQFLFILLPTVILARLRYPGVRGFFRIKLPGPKETLLSVLAVFALQQILQGYMMMQDAIPLPQQLQEPLDMFKRLLEEMYKPLVTAHSPLEFIFVVVVIAVTPAICEEVLFRGLVQHEFSQGASGMGGAIIAGLIFAAYHINPFTFIPLFALGAFFGFLVYRSQNLTIAMFAHFFNNFVACTAMYMQLDDDFVAVAPGGNVTPVDLLINFSLFGVVFVAATYYFIRVTKPTTNMSGRGG